MNEFSYAHFDTSSGERESCTAKFNTPALSSELEKLRKFACAREIPVSDSETLCFLKTVISALQPKNILELGTAVGLSGLHMLSCCDARLTTVEKNSEFYEEALKNFKDFGQQSRVNAILGDAGDVIEELNGGYDFIFLDCAKVQYVKYLPRLKKLLKAGGVLLADDVLLYGYVTGERETPKKRKMLVEHVKEYIAAVTHDSELSTTVLNIGNGLAMSTKRQ